MHSSYNYSGFVDLLCKRNVPDSAAPTDSAPAHLSAPDGTATVNTPPKICNPPRNPLNRQ